MTKLIIAVTKEDIKLGTPEDDQLCPVARALKRNKVKEPCVTSDNVHCLWRQVAHSLPLPRIAINFIKRFDEHKPVKPFQFTLRLP